MTITFQIFAKAPVPGQVKTRLIPALSPSGAAALHVRMVERAAAAVRAAIGLLTDARGELWCTPDILDPVLGRIARDHDLALRQQPEGDLGDRMAFALSQAMPGRALLMGSDIPALDSHRLVTAATALDDCDAVVIPSDDGGYVLIGCHDRVPDCFHPVLWSTASVMADTRRLLDAAGVAWRELPPLWDVDVAADLDRIAADPSLRALLENLETIRHPSLVLNEDQPV